MCFWFLFGMNVSATTFPNLRANFAITVAGAPDTRLYGDGGLVVVYWTCFTRLFLFWVAQSVMKQLKEKQCSTLVDNA